VAACQRQADHGDAISQELLGSMYAAGQGIARDYVQITLPLSLAESPSFRRTYIQSLS
jgi:TPR repeat protein